ncbi:MAG: hypothetical protein D6690_01060 [Nitrospirae bacterium]|nr:MAG: hypothetical protein D6690_01060 [Nitrospirota bacterium]
MNIKKISSPLPGERLVGIDPALSPYLERDGRHRSNLYPGRALSPGALILDQRHRDERLILSGQALSPGIVDGLEVALSSESAGAGPSAAHIVATVAPGRGLTLAGDDLVVLHPQRIPLGNIPVYGPLSWFEEGGDTHIEAEGTSDAESTVMTPRRLGSTIQELQARGVAIPPAGILMLQPVVAEMIGELDPHDPCEQDPQQDAFDDWQIVDGCRLIWYAWPTEWLPLPPVSPQWRNELAYRIFAREAALTAQKLHLPWEPIGLPIALLGLPLADQTNPGSPAVHLAFQEGHSLFQSFTARSPLLGSVALQLHAARPHERDLAIHLQIREDTPTGRILGRATRILHGPFRRAESRPVSFQFPEPLPLVSGRTYVIELLPPADNEKILRWSASTGNAYPDGTAFHPKTGNPLSNRDCLFTTYAPPFVDRSAVARQGGTRRNHFPLMPEEGRPSLLHARIHQFAEQLAEWDLTKRPIEHAGEQFRFLPPFGVMPRTAPAMLPHHDASRFFPEFQVEAAPIPEDQLGQVVSETMPLTPFDRTDASDERVLLLVPVPQAAYEPALLTVEQIDPHFEQAVQELVERRGKWLNRRADVRSKAQVVTQAITGEAPVYPSNNDDPDNVEPDEFVAQDPLDPDDPLLASPEDAFGTTATTTTGPDGTTATRRTVDLVEAFKAEMFPEGHPLAGELTRLTSGGLTAFIQHLEAVIAKLDDHIDFGFVRVQTDLYRIRQHILGTAEATRLATSPILASIAKGESARATKEEIKRFLSELKQSVVSPSAPGASTPREAEEPPSAARATTETSGTTGFRAVPAGAFIASATASTLTTKPSLAIKPDLLTLADRAALRKAVESQARTAPATSMLIDVGKKHDVVEQLPIYGKTYDLRNVTIAKRFEEPKPSESKAFSLASKHETLAGLAALAAANEAILDDIPVYGVQKTGVDADPRTGLYERELLPFGTIRTNLSRIIDEKDPAKVDEATWFQDAVTVLDSTVATFRAVEARIQEYRQLLNASRELLHDLRVLESTIERRLEAIGEHLAEARHDVAVAQALFAEEMDRIRAINERRRTILMEHVTAVAFVRPRTQEIFVNPRDMPVRPLHPALTESPVPACSAHRGELPPELEQMMEVLRDAPVKWFPAIPPLLKRLDRWESLYTTIHTSIARARVRPVSRSTSFEFPSHAPRTMTKQATKPLLQALAVQAHAVAQYRTTLARFDLGLLTDQTWKGLYGHVVDTVSIGDVIDSPHGRSDLIATASRELETIARIASCLYEAMGRIPAPIRLQWVQVLSQFDRPVLLRNLANLPRWHEVEFSTARELQLFVDWLYGRIDARLSEAVAFMTDLVRICILLASHAPVKDIIAGRIAEPASAIPGTLITIRALDARRIRAGMSIHLFSGSTVIGRAVVEDLAGEAVTARIIASTQPQATLPQDARVQFVGGNSAEALGQEAQRQTTNPAWLF